MLVASSHVQRHGRREDEHEKEAMCWLNTMAVACDKVGVGMYFCFTKKHFERKPFFPWSYSP